ncbi:MAG: hypothetical protein J6D06_04055 [Clostridia bacterium]|nr:hypothetical protein [Clostridia bacterium]
MGKTISFDKKKKDEILLVAEKLIDLYQKGELGGETMPEDSNPHLDLCSEENLLYFTLPMALNYQRNSYKLWEAAKTTYEDETTNVVFSPNDVCNLSINELRQHLLKYKVALQPNKHPEIWMKISETLAIQFQGSVRNFISYNDFSVDRIKSYMLSNKKSFPYISGEKIRNYWLYVIEQYSDIHFIDREKISVAPDTHVLQASKVLGLINDTDLERSDIRDFVSSQWAYIFEGTSLCPIDIHTPLWLWSRNGFTMEVNGYGGTFESGIQLHL